MDIDNTLNMDDTICILVQTPMHCLCWIFTGKNSEVWEWFPSLKLVL